MTVNEFATKYDIGQKGTLKQIAFNIKELGEMLQNHTLDEISDIIEDMCSVTES